MPECIVAPAVPMIVPAPTLVETTVKTRKPTPILFLEMSQPEKSTRSAQCRLTATTPRRYAAITTTSSVVTAAPERCHRASPVAASHAERRLDAFVLVKLREIDGHVVGVCHVHVAKPCPPHEVDLVVARLGVHPARTSHRRR